MDKIIINEETTNTEAFFLHGRWLAKDEDDGEIEREIPASNKDGQTYAPLTYYKITTVTGNYLLVTQFNYFKVTDVVLVLMRMYILYFTEKTEIAERENSKVPEISSRELSLMLSASNVSSSAPSRKLPSGTLVQASAQAGSSTK
jgi:hypothetical protein